MLRRLLSCAPAAPGPRANLTQDALRSMTSESPITIRPATITDAEALVALMNPIIAAGTDSIMTEALTVEGQAAFIESLGPRAVYRVAERDRDGRIVGAQDILPASNEPALHHVGAVSTFVAHDTRRCGIGRRLLAATTEAARTCGYRKLLAMIRADNAAAVAFYTRNGFETVGTAREHARVGERYVDEVITELHLVPGVG